MQCSCSHSFSFRFILFSQVFKVTTTSLIYRWHCFYWYSLSLNNLHFGEQSIMFLPLQNRWALSLLMSSDLLTVWAKPRVAKGKHGAYGHRAGSDSVLCLAYLPLMCGLVNPLNCLHWHTQCLVKLSWGWWSYTWLTVLSGLLSGNWPFSSILLISAFQRSTASHAIELLRLPSGLLRSPSYIQRGHTEAESKIWLFP